MKTTGVIFILIALGYISWFFATEDVGAILLFINMVAAAALFLVLSSDKKPKIEWFSRRKFKAGWYPETQEGWMTVLITGILILLALAAAGRNASSIANMFTTALPFIFVILGTFFAIVHKTGDKKHWPFK